MERDCTHHLQFVLPELLLLRLIQKRELADMMHKDISQNRQLRVKRADLAKLGLEGGAETLECGGGVELSDFLLDLLGDELALEI